MTNYESKEIHYLEMEILKLKEQNKKLRKKLNKAKEALKFYADSDCYEKFGSYGLSEIDEDGGEWAQKDEPCILAIKTVAYTALKGVIK